MQTLWNDIRFALRQMRKAPGFALTVVITLTLGIGANTAIFSVMNAVLLRTLPVHEPDKLFFLLHKHAPDGIGATGDFNSAFGINVYQRLREDRSAFSDVIAYVPLSETKTPVRYGNTPEKVEADEVSGNFFSALGVPMTVGQAFAAVDEEKHSQVAVLSYGYWNQRFNRNPGVIGQSIYVDGVPLTIVGVAAPHFYGVETGGASTDLWIPLQNRPELSPWGVPATNDHNLLYGSPNWWNLRVMARLKAGLSLQQALARANPVFAHAARETLGKEAKPDSEKLELATVPAKGLGTSSQGYEAPLHILMGMVALVLVIACVNIVMLLVARNAAREREFALRLALGASRWPIFRQLLTESALLVAAGAFFGWLFAIEATRLLAIWSHLEISLDPDKSVLAFTLVISALAAILFGLAPLRTAAKASVGLVLKSSGTQTTATRSRMLSGKILIAMQMAFCVVLLFASGLLLRTLRNYQNVDLGMQAESVLAFGASPLGSPSSAEKVVFYHHLIERLSVLPGVRSVTLAGARPGTGWSDNSELAIDGHEYPFNGGENMLRTNDVAPNFFKTLGIPMLAGRDVLDSDTQASRRIAVVNQTLVDRYMKGTSPIGHTLGTSLIVGVVRDSKYASADESKMPMVWYSYQQSDAIGNMDVEIRTAGNPLALLPEIRRVMREIDPNIPLGNPQSLSAGFEQTYLMPALFARLAIFFGGLAALLVAIGLYGTLAYRVNRRSLEIGVRMALGADRSQVLWMILRDSLYLVAAGLIVGLPLAWFASKMMTSMLYELSIHDPLSFIAAGMGVLVVSIAAALIPARRAASVEPMQALRSE